MEKWRWYKIASQDKIDSKSESKFQIGDKKLNKYIKKCLKYKT